MKSLDFVTVQAGIFTMRAENEPDQRVGLQGFAISKTVVTNEQFCSFLNDIAADKIDPYWFGGSYDEPIWQGSCHIQFDDEIGQYIVMMEMEQHPVTFVTSEAALAFCQWLSDKNGRKYSLPTEAQWVFAAQGGNLSKGYACSGSDDPNEVAWYDENTIENQYIRFMPVGLKKPNELGLYDMSGNVYEWCLDEHDNWTEIEGIQINPVVTDVYYSSPLFVIRGGSAIHPKEECGLYCRNYGRELMPFIGFRVVENF